MGIRRVVCAVGLTVVTVASSQAVAAAVMPSAAATYYLALGDSLSVGYMPAHLGADGVTTVPAGDTDQGYADQLFQTLKATDPNLQLVKLGCSGETTTTMLEGGICAQYKDGNSQVAAAETFLRAHPGQVKYVTNDIGANDIGFNPVLGIATLSADLLAILTRLKAAGGLKPTYVGMNYYNPGLASYLTGPTGAFFAAVTSLLEYVINSTEENEYRTFGVRTADVAEAFHSYDYFSQAAAPPHGTVPVNVANICTLTYMCSANDIHANVAGHKVIADAFVTALQ
ncbi:MAG: SGNH/GDSL hydrolase family protein [Mycobacteriaceae bacterium]